MLARDGAGNTGYDQSDINITIGSPNPADITGDGVVNVNDLLAVINSWGACATPCPPYCAADITHDCVVNVNGLLMVINNWG